jgi:vacuolar-type H+-ATPase subunit E/Vma4
MEKVWEELKTIEAQAQQIKSDASEKAKGIIQHVKQDAENLLSNTSKYADEEAHKLYTKAITEANSVRDSQLSQNRETAEKLRIQAQENMDKAVDAIAKSVLED